MRTLDCSQLYNRIVVALLPHWFACRVAPPVVVPPDVPPVVVPPAPVVQFVDGNKAMDGIGPDDSETYCHIGGMGVRLLANDDSKVQCKEKHGYYWIKAGLINQTGAFTVSRLVNGDAVVTGRDFDSPESGLHYQFVGWTVYYSASPLVTQNPVTISNLHDTLRGYWRTVKQ